MASKVSYKKLVLLLLCGIAGCIFMGGSDYLMIYGNTAFEGELAWLTLGAAEIPAGRNALALAMAFPAVIFYALGLLAVRFFINEEKDRKNYSVLTVIGMTPWLCLHLFYIMILFAFGFLMQRGDSETAYILCEAMFGQFSWLVMAGEIIMLLPFIYLIVLMLKLRTVFKKAMALNNPVLIFVILKILTMLMPDAPFRLAFTNGLMSEAMLIWFIVFVTACPKNLFTEES